MVTVIALVCPRCGAPALVAPGVALLACNACSTAYDLAGAGPRPLPILEPEIEDRPGHSDLPTVRLPFLRFEADAPGAPPPAGSRPRAPFPWEEGVRRDARPAVAEPAPVHVMAFSLERIGSTHDDGARLTFNAPPGGLRPGRLDAPPEIGVASAAALARFLALRVLDRDGRRGLAPESIRLGAPSILAVAYAVDGDVLIDRRTGTRLSGIRPAAGDLQRAIELSLDAALRPARGA